MLRLRYGTSTNRSNKSSSSSFGPVRSHPSAASARLAAAGRRVCRKYRQASIRRLQQVEYDRLCRIVPSLARKQHRRRISKVKVVEETIRYIDQLHRALVDRVQSKSGQTEVSDDEVVDAARQTFLDASAAILSSSASAGAESAMEDRTAPCLASSSSVGVHPLPAATASSSSSSSTSGFPAVVVCENERRVPTYAIKADMLSPR